MKVAKKTVCFAFPFSLSRFDHLLVLEKPTKVNGVHSAAVGKSSTIMSRSQPAEANQWKSIGVAPRDPKARARSREYLKQYVIMMQTLWKYLTCS